MTGFIYQQWCILLQHCYPDLLIVEQVQSKFLIKGKLLDTLPASVGILGKIFINIVLTRSDFNENKDYIHNKVKNLRIQNLTFLAWLYLPHLLQLSSTLTISNSLNYPNSPHLFQLPTTSSFSYSSNFPNSSNSPNSQNSFNSSNSSQLLQFP